MAAMYKSVKVADLVLAMIENFIQVHLVQNLSFHLLHSCLLSLCRGAVCTKISLRPILFQRRHVSTRLLQIYNIFVEQCLNARTFDQGSKVKIMANLFQRREGARPTRVHTAGTCWTSVRVRVHSLDVAIFLLHFLKHNQLAPSYIPVSSYQMF